MYDCYEVSCSRPSMRENKVLRDDSSYGFWSHCIRLLLVFKAWETITLKMLSTDTRANIRLPTLNEFISYREAIERKYSMLSDGYCVTDVLKLHRERSGSSLMQKMFYNGYTHDHYVGNVFVFPQVGS